jgi:hypothetical protein
MTRELCRRVTAGTVSYRALPPAKPDLGLGAPAIAVVGARTMGGLDFAAGWITRPGRLPWRLAVWIQASPATCPQRVRDTCWGIRRALQTAAYCHQAAMGDLYAEHEAARRARETPQA